jgi:diguanylate cyclase (GGDEF)-like protein/PAS domain S-box-containing protein
MLEKVRIINLCLFSEKKNLAMNNNTNSDTFLEKLEAELEEVFNALKRIASGDPTVRISEYSEIKSIRNLKYMVNTTAKEIGEIVEQSHEFAIGIAEHFDVLLRVSHGDFDARVTGSSETELLESLKNVTNKMIENIDRENTERKKATRTLRESEEKFRSLVHSTDDSIYVVDRDYRYVFINKKHLKRLGLSEDEYPGRLYKDYHSPEETRLFIEKAEKVFSRGESVHHEYQSLRDGRYFLLTLSPVKKEDGTVTAVTVLSKDVTDFKLMEEKLRKLSLTDELTGLYNRRGFYTLAEHLMRAAHRNGMKLYLLYIDLDNMKVINDKYGHKEGDKALAHFGQILRENYRESDVISRIGGDEFAIIMQEGNTDSTIEKLISRLHRTLSAEIAKKEDGYILSASIGVASYEPSTPSSLDDLLSHADRMMYRQKQSKLDA